LFSSSNTNNWQTLDIHHYFALYDWPNRKLELEGQCVSGYSVVLCKAACCAGCSGTPGGRKVSVPVRTAAAAMAIRGPLARWENCSRGIRDSGVAGAWAGDDLTAITLLTS
jgi:hypothetical protein